MNAKKLLFLMVLLIFSVHVRCASSSLSSSSSPAVFGSQAHSPAGLLFNIRLVLASDDEKVYTSWVKDVWVSTAKPLII